MFWAIPMVSPGMGVFCLSERTLVPSVSWVSRAMVVTERFGLSSNSQITSGGTEPSEWLGSRSVPSASSIQTVCFQLVCRSLA